ncbi:hypothetical protein NIES2119_30270 [[Phormidium ambiguum] IAM M-71]|uniref:Uncharacterized protein n=1 Tax=[Phormidium ambiguum] IAM M-71 TaxID=454136 RepID=A0A1U7I3W4_9CYAN|nr:hypothetical protein NIES2119_30270 [Phormidium ambiguum IAM M-71]
MCQAGEQGGRGDGGKGSRGARGQGGKGEKGILPSAFYLSYLLPFLPSAFLTFCLLPSAFSLLPSAFCLGAFEQDWEITPA